MVNWNANDIPSQSGKVVIVTGANSGLGYETTLALVRKNAHVIMACRNLEKGQRAVDLIEAKVPGASVELMPLDLASLASIHAFAESFIAKYDHLDQLYNNAGVMAIPRRETADGFEMQFGTNHLGHFALTGLLLPTLLQTPHSRVITTSSGLHRTGKMDFDDLQHEKSYTRYGAYSQSKLANILFMLELERRLMPTAATTISVGGHPGFSNTNLQSNSAEASGSGIEKVMYSLGAIFAQSQAMGALPQLYAGTASDVVGGEYYGPSIMSMRGNPTLETPSDAARNEADAARLWAISEELTGVHYRELDKVPAI